MMAAALLIPGVTRLRRCPRIADVTAMAELLKKFGVLVWWEGEVLCLDASRVQEQTVLQEETKKTRACVLLLGALLGRLHSAGMAYPGGCAIGDRPVNLHLDAFRRMGIVVMEKEQISCRADQLQGGEISFPISSVGATQNVILAAVLAKGETRIHQAALEPEVQALCLFLKAAGADISGIGTRHLRITGVSRLSELEYLVPADRIVAGTYLTAVLSAGGEVLMEDVPVQELTAVTAQLRQAGACISILPQALLVTAKGRLEAFDYLRTSSYPGFPTDMQSQFMALAAGAHGISVIEETIFNDRFRVAGELIQMGAEIYLEENKALVHGQERLHGADVTASDLRGGAALVTAALKAEGTTRLGGYEYLARGYEGLVENLRMLGADIRRQKD